MQVAKMFFEFVKRCALCPMVRMVNEVAEECILFLPKDVLSCFHRLFSSQDCRHIGAIVASCRALRSMNTIDQRERRERYQQKHERS